MTAPARRPHRDAAPGAPWLELLIEVLRDTPRLRGAACVDHRETFDAAADADPVAIEAAQAICASCPALDRCRAWPDTVPPGQRAPGVTAGVYRHQSTKRGRPAASPTRKENAR